MKLDIKNIKWVASQNDHTITDEAAKKAHKYAASRIKDMLNNEEITKKFAADSYEELLWNYFGK